MARRDVDIVIRARDRTRGVFARVAKRVRQFAAIGYAAAAYAVGRAIQASVAESMRFEQQLAMVNTMLGKQTAHYLPQYRQALDKLSMDLGESTETLSKGLYDVLSAGVPAAEAVKVLGVAGKAAIGGLSDTATAVNALTNLLNTFQLEGAEAAHVSDLLFATVKSGKITFEQLATNIGKVAPMAKAAGMDMRTMMAAIATLTRQGLSAEEAMTQLRAIMQAMPEDAGDLLTVVQRFRGKDLAEILGVVPESRAARGLSALSGDIEGLMKDLKTMAAAGGAAEEAFEKMSATGQRKVAQFQQAINSLQRSVGDQLAPAFGELAVGIREDIIPAVKDLAKVLNEDLTPAIRPLTKAVGWLGKIASYRSEHTWLRMLTFNPASTDLPWVYGKLWGMGKDIWHEMFGGSAAAAGGLPPVPAAVYGWSKPALAPEGRAGIGMGGAARGTPALESRFLTLTRPETEEQRFQRGLRELKAVLEEILGTGKETAKATQATAENTKDAAAAPAEFG